MYEKLFLKSLHFFLGCRRAFVFALARLEVVDDIQCDTSAVVALAFVNKHSVGVHRPVIVGSVEYVGGRQFDGQQFVKESLTQPAASIVNHVEPNRLVCISPRVCPLMLAVISQPLCSEKVLSK